MLTPVCFREERLTPSQCSGTALPQRCKVQSISWRKERENRRKIWICLQQKASSMITVLYDSNPESSGIVVKSIYFVLYVFRNGNRMNECLHTWSTDIVHPQELNFFNSCWTKPNFAKVNGNDMSCALPTCCLHSCGRQAKVVQLSSGLQV